jgi:hypothetical protein
LGLASDDCRKAAFPQVQEQAGIMPFPLDSPMARARPSGDGWP